MVGKEGAGRPETFLDVEDSLFHIRPILRCHTVLPRVCFVPRSQDFRVTEMGACKVPCHPGLARISVPVWLRRHLTVRPVAWNFIYGSKYLVSLLEIYIFNLKHKNVSFRLNPQNAIY